MSKITSNKAKAAGFGTAAVMGVLMLAAGAVTPAQAQYCPNTGSCSNRTIAADPTNPYQMYIAAQTKAAGAKRGVKSVLLYDQAPGHSDGKQALRRSLSRLSQKYGFRLDIQDQNGYITAATLAGVDVVVFSQGDGDVLGGMSSASTVAMENFTYAQGGSVLLVHAAAAYIQCPTSGGSDLANANCRFLARAAARQYLQHQADNTPVRIYADSVAAGEIPPYGSLGATNNLGPVPPVSVTNHGRRNDETKNIFDTTGTIQFNSLLPRNSATDGRRTVWDALGCEWYNYSSSPRTVGNMSRTVAGTVYTEGRVNILLSMDELSRNIGSQRMGDHPQAWTRKMGNGLSAYQNAGHSDIYIRTRGTTANPLPGGGTSNDSLVEKFNWNLLRYLARDYVGCMDPNFAEYNPAATVERLTEADPATQCVTPTSTISVAGPRNTFQGVTVKARGFEIKTPEAGFYRVSVTDLSGRSVYSKTVVGGANKNIELTNLSKGSYFVRVTNPAKALSAVRVEI